MLCNDSHLYFSLNYYAININGIFLEWQPEDFVPFIEYKPSLDTYQWIGAGRDSDTRLGELCNCWLHNLNSISSKIKSCKEEVTGGINLPIPPTSDIISTIDVSEINSSLSLPTPLLDTWIVTLSNAEERAIFQAQVHRNLKLLNNITKYKTYVCSIF